MNESLPTYVLTQDTIGLFSTIGNQDLRNNQQFLDAADTYMQTVQQTLAATFKDTATVTAYSEEEINQALTERVLSQYAQDPNRIVVCLDRFLLQNLENDPSSEGAFFRFSITRSLDGERVPRQNGDSFEAQIRRIKDSVPDIDQRDVTVVDDGIFSGGTVREFVELASNNGLKLNVKNIIGFLGTNQTQGDSTQPDILVAQPIDKLYDWVDIRDFGPFAGRRLQANKTNTVTTSVPYIYPWSEGEGASLNLSPSLYSDSIAMIGAFRDLVVAYEQSTGNSGPTFRELVKAGFPLPTDVEKSIPVSINDTVTSYLDRCIGRIETEQAKDVVIFDMDGTIYQLDGENNGFSGSTLETTVNQRALEFILNREQCDEDEARRIMEEGLRDPIGLSRYLADRYGIARTEYFDTVWDIDPTPIASTYDISSQSIREFKQINPDTRLVLLTAAPSVWARKVTDFIGVADCFDRIYTGDRYGTKGEVFTAIAGRYTEGTIMSIGDQLKTDIEPAQQVGITGVLINSPDELQFLKGATL